MADWGHDQLMMDLAHHLRGNPLNIVWEDMQMGPSGSPRPDVYVIKKSYSRFAPQAFEVKVTLSDFRSDVTSGKWQKYLDYASSVIFAVPAGLINKDDIPKGCGLIVRHENVWRTAKKPVLHPFDGLSQQAWMKLMMDGIERQGAEHRIKRRTVHAGPWIAEQRLRKKHGAEVARLVREALSAREALEAQVTRNLQITESLKKETHEAVQLAQRAAERSASKLDNEVRLLAKDLGLPNDASAWDVRNAINNFRQSMVEDPVVSASMRALDRARQTLDDEREKLSLLLGENKDNRPAA